MSTVPTNEELSAQVAALTSQVTALTTAVTTVTNNLNSNAPRGGTPSFALTPGQIRPEDLVDYETRVGDRIWTQSIRALDTKFDMTSKHSLTFVENLSGRAAVNGWNQGSKSIFHFKNKAGKDIDLIHEYGQITLEELTTQCEQMTGTGAEVNTRMAQNNAQCRECLLNTLTPEANARLLTHREDYRINATNAAGKAESYLVAPLMYKVIMTCATIDSKATEQTLRDNLSACPQFMAVCKSNIPEYHCYFDENYSQLLNRGCTYDAPVQALFQGYLVADDSEFRRYMERQFDDFLDERGDMKDISVAKIMAMALSKYNFRVNKGMWGAKSAAEQRIVAMNAEIADLRGKLKLTGAKGKGGKGTKPGSKPPFKAKNKKNTSDKKKQKQDEAWKKVPPKDGEPTTKTVGGRTFKWCIHHMAWANHTSEECRVGQERKAEQASSTANSATTSTTVASSSSMNYLAALAAASRDE
jgi:hypothetical protein